ATTFVDLLAAAGWHTALIGKCHLQSMSPAKPTLGMPEVDPALVLPPEELREAEKITLRLGRYDQELRSTWVDNPDHEMDLPYYGFQHVELCTGHGDKVHGHYGRWLEQRHPGSDALRGPENQLPGNDYVVPQAWRTAVPEELYPTSYVAERTCAFLEGHAKDSPDQPFFIQCSFPDPHHPFTPPGRYWDMYSPDDVGLPASFHSNHPLPPHLRAIQELRAAGKANVDGQRAIGVSEREAREAIALSYGMITMVDDQIARVLAKLDELGLSDDTVVIFTADHGDFMGDHAILLKAALHYQGVVRVPFILADPADGEAGLRDDLAGTIDIANTILARAGVAPFNGMQGRDLGSTLEDPDLPVVIEEHQRYGYMGFNHGFRARTLMGRRYRMTIYEDANGFGELYDLQNDPAEQINLYEDDAYRDLRHELTEQLVHRLITLTDTSPLATHHGP
ncbi:MAG: sulfatase-like hydrolase/transferase, partial [Alphaproteobacteria bacterium]|nr:sulfatase-like hydrolase/transferase [Alphaproteobacteria bacterium]